MPKTLVVTPTYNEAENIEKLIGDVLSKGPDIHMLVVDDSSPDGTGSIVEKLKDGNPRIHLIRRSGKLGLGTAYVAGFKFALSHNYDFVLEMDADFSHNPNEIPNFLKKMNGCDVVLGSRYADGVRVVNWPIRRLILSFSANLYTRIITGLPVHDATSGFKCFKRNVLESIDLEQIRSNGYAFQIEMVFHAWKKGFRICEIPITFVDRRSGVSKMSKKIVYEAAFMVWKLKLRSMLNRL
jgi:dolichol-phosphate mannosyltransferase